MSAIAWLVDHTVGWLFDHTIGWMVGRSRARDRVYADLAIVADALGDAVGECQKVGRGSAGDFRLGQDARQHAARAVALSTRVPDEKLAKLVTATRDGIDSYVDRHDDRKVYMEPSDAAMSRIRELRSE